MITLNSRMTCAIRASIACGLILVGSFASARAGVTVANAGFEQPAQSPGDAVLTPSLADQGGAGWTFTGSSGVQAAGIGNYNPGAVPEGNNVAFLQTVMGDPSSITQLLSGFSDGDYKVGFYAAGRVGYGTNPFIVTIDGVDLTFGGSTTITPQEVTSGYQYFLSDQIGLTAGSHTLSFVSAGSPLNDVTSFIDNVSVNSVPEPATIITAVMGIAGVAALIRKRKTLAV